MDIPEDVWNITKKRVYQFIKKYFQLDKCKYFFLIIGLLIIGLIIIGLIIIGLLIIDLLIIGLVLLQFLYFSCFGFIWMNKRNT